MRTTPQLAQTEVQTLARKLDAVQRVREHEHRDLRHAVRDEDPAAEVRSIAGEDDRVDEFRASRIAKLTGINTTPKSAYTAQVRALRYIDREAEHEYAE
jgi:hypothetical protein